MLAVWSWPVGGSLTDAILNVSVLGVLVSWPPLRMLPSSCTRNAIVGLAALTLLILAAGTKTAAPDVISDLTIVTGVPGEYVLLPTFSVPAAAGGAVIITAARLFGGCELGGWASARSAKPKSATANV